jgi:SHS2 domain-containing protein
MGFDFFDHTGDIGVRLQAATLDGLFLEAVQAFADIITTAATVELVRAWDIQLRADTPDLLLRDFLAELLYRFDVQQDIARSASVQVASDPTGWSLCAQLRGERLDSSRHPVKVLVKAVTYHRLEVVADRQGWHATVIFDI